MFIDPIVAAIGLLQPEYVSTGEGLAGVRMSAAFVEDARQVMLLVPGPTLPFSGAPLVARPLQRVVKRPPRLAHCCATRCH